MNLSRAQLSALFFLWEHNFENELKTFLQDMGISFTEDDDKNPSDYIKKYIGEVEYAQYSG